MFAAFRDVDRVLRGDATQLEALRRGEIELEGRRLLGAVIVLAAIYGACMGGFAVARVLISDDPMAMSATEAWLQMLSSAVKVPILFFATLLITLPSLYVFNTLLGSNLTFRSIVRLMAAMMAVAMAVLASLGPIVAFFSISSTSYPFIKLLNVVCCAVAGFIGLIFLLRTLDRLLTVHRNLHDPEAATAADLASEAEPPPDAPVDAIAVADPAAPPAALAAGAAPTDERAGNLFRVWVIVFGIVGAQMSWILRPFIGDPELPFALLRSRDGNVFTDVFRAIIRLLGVDL